MRTPGIGGFMAFLHPFASAIGMRMALAVLGSIIVIEALILVPSYYRYEQDLLTAVRTENSALVRGLTATDDATRDGMIAGLSSLRSRGEISAFALVGTSGSILVQEGNADAIDKAVTAQTGLFDADTVAGRRIAMSFPVPGVRGVASAAVEVDGSPIDDKLAAFVWRISGLVLLISLSTTLVVTLVLNRLILKPTLALRDRLVSAAGDTERTENHLIDIPIAHELGEMKDALNGLLARMADYRRLSQRRSDQRFRDFADSASDWFWEMDANLRFSYFSDRFEEVSGVAPKALLGMTRQETGIPGVDEATWEKHLDDLANHRPFRNFCHPRTKADGKVVHLSISGQPVFEDNGDFAGYRGTGRDITDLVVFEQSLLEQKEKAEYADRTKSEFLANMSHELRTPLNAIIGFSELIRDQVFGPVGDERYLEYGSHVTDSAQHLLSIINDILDLSKIEAGEETVEHEWIELAELFENCVRFVRERAKARRIVIDIANDPELYRLLTDERKLSQIIINLLTNAVKYASEEGSVTIGSRLLPDGDLMISVEDDGNGIPEDLLPRVFDPFARANSAVAREQEGTGLGLPLCKRLTELLGGRIEMRSEAGIGTCVSILIPARMTETARTEQRRVGAHG